MARRGLAAGLALAVAVAAPAPSRAAGAVAEPGSPVRLHLGAALDFGSSRLVTAEMADGSHQSIDANDGLSLQLGASLARGPVSLRATAGAKASVINASNARIWYVAFPVELLGFWELRWARLGGGLSLALEPRLFGSGDASRLDLRFDPSVGVVLQGEWVLRTASGSTLSVGPRFTWQRLRLHSNGDSVGANAFGVVLGWTT